MTTQQNRRQHERVSTKLPVRLGELTGLTRNVSAHGICFEVDDSYKPGSEISFLIELTLAGKRTDLKCQGRIVRIEDIGPRKSVSLEITQSIMDTPN
jgi:hypothetical protein